MSLAFLVDEAEAIAGRVEIAMKPEKYGKVKKITSQSVDFFVPVVLKKECYLFKIKGLKKSKFDTLSVWLLNLPRILVDR